MIILSPSKPRGLWRTHIFQVAHDLTRLPPPKQPTTVIACWRFKTRDHLYDVYGIIHPEKY
jgi:hypothetical protein